MIVALNMMDEAERKGVRVDTEALSRRLGVPVLYFFLARWEPVDVHARVAQDRSRRLLERGVVALRGEVERVVHRHDALELPLNTVRVYLHRGRRKIREELKEAYGHVATA